MSQLASEVLSSPTTIEQFASTLRGVPRAGVDLPLRAELMKLPRPAGLAAISLFVHRNHAFEFSADVMKPFLWFAGYDAQIEFGDYDDSLAFAGLNASAVQLVSLDFNRYTMADGVEAFTQWLAGRIRNLREQTDSAIVVANWASDDAKATHFNEALRKLLPEIPGLSICDLENLRRQLQIPFYDPRAAKFKGTPFSDAACILAARDLGLTTLPSILGPRLKVLALDLDNTLYEGVLGEDGIAGIQIDGTHAQIHGELLRLRSEGVFLALTSRNEPQDVQELLSNRGDLSLRAEHFSSMSIGWHSKIDGLKRIAQELRIGLDSILFVDDNPGEIAQVRQALPTVQCIHAATSADTLFWLRHYPRLHGYRVNSTSQNRIADLAAEKQRALLQESATDVNSYLESLKVEVSLGWNPVWLRDRLVEISNKTNQFNTALQRFSAVEIARRLESPDCATISFAMRDRLSDSGNIGALFAHREKGIVVVDEICISCRALGRNIESGMITTALQRLTRHFAASQVAFRFEEGPRNSPARSWLQGYLGREEVLKSGEHAIPWSELPGKQIHLTLPIAYKWEQNG